MSVHTASKPLGLMTRDRFDIATNLLSLGIGLKEVSRRTKLSYTTVRRIQTGELQRPETWEGYVPPPKDRNGDQPSRTPLGHLPQTPATPDEPEED